MNNTYNSMNSERKNRAEGITSLLFVLFDML